MAVFGNNESPRVVSYNSSIGAIRERVIHFYISRILRSHWFNSFCPLSFLNGIEDEDEEG